jgi:hypothetical protein
MGNDSCSNGLSTVYFCMKASFFVTFVFHELFKDHTAYNLEIAVPAQFHPWVDRTLSFILHFSFQERMVSASLSFKEILGSLDHADTRIVPECDTKDPERKTS